jgi:hypothetical protein
VRNTKRTWEHEDRTPDFPNSGAEPSAVPSRDDPERLPDLY